MPALQVIDRIAPAARCPPLQAAQLADQPLMIEQPHAIRIEQRQKVYVQIVFVPLADLVGTAGLAKWLADHSPA